MNEDTTSTNSVHTMDIDMEEQSFPPEESNSRKRKCSRSDEELSAVRSFQVWYEGRGGDTGRGRRGETLGSQVTGQGKRSPCYA
jgi:hypothetical protein